MPTLTAVAAIIGAYLLGSISFAVVVTRIFGIQDPRTFGSGNPGATNVLRSGSKKAALLTLILDALKGYLPVTLGLWLTPHLGWSIYAAPVMALAAFLGHLYPLFFKFKGGKGVATAAGVLLGAAPLMAFAALCTWLLVAIVFRYSSLASLAAAVCAPLYYIWIYGLSLATAPMIIAIAVMGLLLIYRHKQNIKNLCAGTESKIGKKS